MYARGSINTYIRAIVSPKTPISIKVHLISCTMAAIRYDDFNFGGLRFLVELFSFVNAQKEGGITSRFLFFKAIFAY